MIEFDIWWNSAAADSLRAQHEDMGGEQFRPVWDAAVRASQAPAPAHANDRWTLISPRGAIFMGETPLRAANEANKHVRATDPAEAKKWADMMERLRAENEAENERLLAEHGTLNCPTCGGSGHIGDAQAPAVGDGLETPDYAVEINRLRNVIQAACSGGLDHMIERWKVLFPDAPVPTVRAPAMSRDCPHCNYTGSVHCGDVADKIKAKGGELGYCSNAQVYGKREGDSNAPVQGLAP